MAKYINIGDTIEGGSINCTVRKWLSRGLKKHPITNKTMSLYVTDRNSTAEILEPIAIQENDETTVHFHREVGDILQADALSVYIDEKKKIVPVPNEGATHRHGANFVRTKKHTIAEIKVPLAVFKKLLGYSSNQIEK